MTNVDRILCLAAIIRDVDGGNKLGAAALAEAILCHKNFVDCIALAQSIDAQMASGMIPMEYADVDSCARIVYEPSEDYPSRGCWTVRNSRHINPCVEFATAEAAYGELKQAIITTEEANDVDIKIPDFLPANPRDAYHSGRIAREAIAQADATVNAVLGQPAPPSGGVMPTDDEWDALVEQAWGMYETIGYQGERFMYDRDFGNALDYVRKELTCRITTLLQQHSQPVPVPVSERLPGPEDCDGEGQVWQWDERSDAWVLYTSNGMSIRHAQGLVDYWLSAHQIIKGGQIFNWSQSRSGS